MFKVDGKEKEGEFTDVLFVPDLKVTLLSVGQLACLPHCKVIQYSIIIYANMSTRTLVK